MSWEDPIVADVRKIREDLAAEFDFELSKIFADLRARQEKLGDRLVRLKGSRTDKHSESPKPSVETFSHG